MGRYLDIAKGVSPKVPESASRSADLVDLTKPESENARRLLEAGWKPKVSFGGRVIWERPDNGFYRSEEAAICLLELSESADPADATSLQLENNLMQDATLPNDFGKKGEG